MAPSPVDAFWTRYVSRAGSYARDAAAVRAALAAFPSPPPALFVQLLTAGRVAAVSAPEFRVGAVGDWLAHALERHRVMLALADAHANPLLASMVPFGDTGHGFEVALDLSRPAARVVWLDPTRFDSGAEAVVAVDSPGIESFLCRRLEPGAQESPRVARD